MPANRSPAHIARVHKRLAAYDRAMAEHGNHTKALRSSEIHHNDILERYRETIADADSERGRYVKAKRKCLGGCGQTFTSSWIGHRVCAKCSGGATGYF